MSAGPLLPEHGGTAASHEPPCSRNPHDKAVVVRRAHVRTTGSHPGEREGNEQAWGKRQMLARRAQLDQRECHSKKQNEQAWMDRGNRETKKRAKGELSRFSRLSRSSRLSRTSRFSSLSCPSRLPILLTNSCN